jgi:hypothetical protein
VSYPLAVWPTVLILLVLLPLLAGLLLFTLCCFFDRLCLSLINAIPHLGFSGLTNMNLGHYAGVSSRLNFFFAVCLE